MPREYGGIRYQSACATPRARLMRALRGEPCDRPPCVCPGGMMNMVTSELLAKAGLSFPEAHTDAAQMARLARAAFDEGCFENCGVPFCMTVEAEGMGAQVDRGSCQREPHVVACVAERLEDWRLLPALDVHAGRAQVVLDALSLLRASGGEVPVVGNLTGPVSLAATLMDAGVLLRAFRRQSEEAHAYLGFIAEQLIAFGRAQVEAGADVVAVSDPSGTAEIMGPRLFEEFTVRHLNAVVDALHACGVPVIVHVCGQMKGAFTQVDAIRADALSFDALVPLREARAALPTRTLMGNVSTYALELGDGRVVRQAVERCVRAGADIVAPACGLGMGSPLANVRALREALEEGKEAGACPR